VAIQCVITEGVILVLKTKHTLLLLLSQIYVNGTVATMKLYTTFYCHFCALTFKCVILYLLKFSCRSYFWK